MTDKFALNVSHIDPTVIKVGHHADDIRHRLLSETYVWPLENWQNWLSAWVGSPAEVNRIRHHPFGARCCQLGDATVEEE